MRNSVKFILMLVLVMSLVGAVKPGIQIIDSGCEIRVPQQTVIATNQDITSHLHVINTTSGSSNRLTATNTVCYAHLYNLTNHILEKNYSADGNDLEFSLKIDGGNFTQLGVHTFYIECVSPDSICASSGSFTVTPSGLLLEEGEVMPSSVIVFLFFGIAIFFLIFARTTEEGGVKLFFNVIGYLMLVFAVGAGYILLQTTQSGLLNLTKGMLFTIAIVFIVIMYYIFINLTKTSLAMFRAKKGFGSEFDNPASF